MVIPSGNRICLAGDWRTPLFSRETKNKLSEVPCIFFPKPRPPTTPLPLDSLSPEFGGMPSTHSSWLEGSLNGGGDAFHPVAALKKQRRSCYCHCYQHRRPQKLMGDTRHSHSFRSPEAVEPLGGLYDIIFPIGSMISNSKYIKYTLVIALISRRSG